MKHILYVSVAIFMSLGMTSKAQNLATTMTVSPGTNVYVSPGTSIDAADLNLKSTSDQYACLLLDGTLSSSTVVNYDRYVNQVGTAGVNGGNDLISMPVKETGDVSFAAFMSYSPDSGLTTNADVIPNSPSTPTLYAFGPYSNSVQSYINYDVVQNANVILTRGVGYRAASYGGQTVRFTGTVSSTTETVNVTTSGNNYWNLIGNPYPTYVNSQTFFDENSAVLDPSATAIYGYNSGTAISEIGTIGNFTIINNLTNSNVNIAPGQGFLVANRSDVPTGLISFTPAMRTFIGTDDFILNRSENPNQMLRLRVDHATANFATEIYFNGNSTLGLDPGYDAEVFKGAGSNLTLYSRLVENDQGRNMAIQSLSLTELSDVIIPLGLKTSQGTQVTFSIENSTLPEATEVYLEDALNTSFTLLNSGSYTFTANTNINGTGRFFLRIGDSTLSTIDQNSSGLSLFSSAQTIHINGQLFADTSVSVYDMQGRLVLTSFLEGGSETNKIDASSLSTGIYVVKLNNEKQAQTKKVLIK